MASCVQERPHIQDTISYWEDNKQFLKLLFTTKLEAAGKTALKQMTLYWAYALPDLGPKVQKGPIKPEAQVSKSVFPIAIGQISYNIKSA